MKARKIKELISQIPDDDELIFTYSMFEFESTGRLLRGKKITEYFEDNDRNIPCSKNTWMVEFKN